MFFYSSTTNIDETEVKEPKPSSSTEFNEDPKMSDVIIRKKKVNNTSTVDDDIAKSLAGAESGSKQASATEDHDHNFGMLVAA